MEGERGVSDTVSIQEAMKSRDGARLPVNKYSKSKINVCNLNAFI